MNRKKLVFSISTVCALISSVCALVIGVIMIVTAVMDKALPKPLYIMFSVLCLANAVVIWMGVKKKKE